MTKLKFIILIIILLINFLTVADASTEIRGVKTSGAASWNAQNFFGFWYDVDTDKSTETLIAQGSISNRVIGVGNLQYNTFVTPIPFKLYSGRGVNVNGKNFFYAIGWQGQEYNAIKGKANKIVKISFEMNSEEKKTMTTGETWSMGSGYEMTINAIDARTNPRQVWFTLKKNGVVVDEGIGQAPVGNDVMAKQKAVYFKTKTIHGETDELWFTIYVDAIFSGATSDMVQFKYAWLVDPNSAILINPGDPFGVFEVLESTNDRIILRNKNSISLSKNSETTLMGEIKFKVADSDTLRFYPFIKYTMPGKYELRGSIIDSAIYNNVQPYWDASNFAGFFYDLKYDISTETLKIDNTLAAIGRTIPEKTLLYQTGKAPVEFKVFEKESVKIDSESTYSLVGWKAEKWIAIKGKTNKLAKLAFEMAKEDKRTLTTGETWSLGSGYELTINTINARTTPREVWFTLKKDGIVVDEARAQAAASSDPLAKQKAVYWKKLTILGEFDSLLFTVYIDNIFSGATSDMVQFKYAWLLDQNSAMEIKAGDIYGIFEVRESNNERIVLWNKYSVPLSRNTETTLIDELKFRIADSDTVRFYPKVDSIIGQEEAINTIAVTAVTTYMPAYMSNVLVTDSPVLRESNNNSNNYIVIAIICGILLFYIFKFKKPQLKVNKQKPIEPIKKEIKLPEVKPLQKKSENVYTLIVEIKNGYNKIPIKKATINIESHSGEVIERISDIDGKVIFGKVREGKYKLKIIFKDFEEHNQEIEITKNNRLVIELKGKATLNLSIVDEINEKPIVGAEIILENIIIKTDEKGNAAISDIAFGSNFIRVHMDSYKIEELSLDVDQIIFNKKIYLKPELKSDTEFTAVGDTIKRSLDESMKKLSSSSDMCIPEYYKSICYEIIRIIERIANNPNYANLYSSHENIYTLFFITEKICKEIESILINEDNISEFINMGYKGYKKTAIATIDLSKYDLFINLFMTDPKEFIAKYKKDTFNKLQYVDQEITKNLQNYNVSSVANLWLVSQKTIQVETKDEATAEAASLLLGNMVLDKTNEMFKNEEIIKRIKK